MAESPFDLVVGTEDEGVRIDKYLVAHDPAHSRARWQQVITEGHVTLNGKPAKPNNVVRAGDRVIALLPRAIEAAPRPEAIVLDVIYEDSDVIVVNKPAGLVVHPGAGNAGGTLVNALLHHCKDLSGIGGVLRPGIVHRIDKDTSGILVVAKNDQAHRSLSKQFESHTIAREYEGYAWGGFRTRRGTLSGTLERDPRNRLRMTGKTGAGRIAITHYEVVGSTPHFSRLRCRLETGRTHQIRVQCAEAGHPLVGDQTYGKTRSISPSMGVNLQAAVKNFPRQALHAAVLGFEALDGRQLRFESQPPEDMQQLWRLMEEEDRG